jgi:hypothetical protein
MVPNNETKISGCEYYSAILEQPYYVQYVYGRLFSFVEICSRNFTIKTRKKCGKNVVKIESTLVQLDVDF